MPVLTTLGRIALSMLASLLTEAFIKRTVVLVLERLVARTESDIDNRILDAAKDAWGLADKANKA
jgi:hypothetical protein